MVPSFDRSETVLRSHVIKGPSLHHHLNVYRVWECPACGRVVRAAGNVTSRTCDCNAAAQMTYQDAPPNPEIEVTPFVTYLQDEFLQEEDDGTDLPLPDLAEIAPAAPQPRGRAQRPGRPLREIANELDVPAGEPENTETRDDFGAGVTQEVSRTGTSTSEAAAAGSATGSQSESAGDGKPKRRRRRRRRGRGERSEGAPKSDTGGAALASDVGDGVPDDASGRETENNAVKQGDRSTTEDGGGKTARRRRRRRRGRNKGSGGDSSSAPTPGGGAES